MYTNLGSWAEWATAAVTLLGFILAVCQLRANLKDSRLARDLGRQEEEANREAMARAVGLKSEWHPSPDGGSPEEDGCIPVTVEIQNAGPYPIRNVVLELATDDDCIPAQIVYGRLLSGEHIADTHRVARTEVTFGELTGGATLKFTDTFDNHWSTSTSWEGFERADAPARIC